MILKAEGRAAIIRLMVCNFFFRFQPLIVQLRGGQQSATGIKSQLFIFNMHAAQIHIDVSSPFRGQPTDKA